MLPTTFSPVEESLERHCRIEVSKEQFCLSLAELEHLVSKSRPLCWFLATARVAVREKKETQREKRGKEDRACIE